MINKMKDIDMEIRTYYFFNGIVNISNFDPKNIKTGAKSCKNNFTYYIKYVTIKGLRYLKINSVNPLYLIFSKVYGYFEENNVNRYLMLIFNN